MKAIQLTAFNKPLEAIELPIPEIKADEVLVKVKAAGICHSDAHYRAGMSPKMPLPMTLGHEVAGVVEKIGDAVNNVKPGDRVCIHYLASCGSCDYCIAGQEQFCKSSKMVGNTIPGGYAEYIAVPARCAVPLPDSIPFEQGATLMCASATSFHALLKGRIKPGEKVAVFGAGGLGQSAIQLAKACGATTVFAIDINTEKLAMAESHGAIAINNRNTDAVQEIMELTDQRGVDIALDLIGLPQVQEQAIACTAPLGRVVFVGLTDKSISINAYKDLIAKETELIGSNDHHLHELPKLLEFVKTKQLDVSGVVSRTIPLEADLINETLDALDNYQSSVRTVIVMD